MLAGIRRAFIQHHSDIAPQRGLDFHGDLRANEGRRAIEMILELNAVLRDLAQLGERENLVASAVGQERSVPVHEAMQTAKMPHYLHPWPNEKVVGVPENDLRLKLAQLARAHAFHRALRPDRHEGRRLDRAVCRREAARRAFDAGSVVRSSNISAICVRLMLCANRAVAPISAILAHQISGRPTLSCLKIKNTALRNDDSSRTVILQPVGVRENGCHEPAPTERLRCALG